MNIQNILSLTLEQEGGFIKVDYKMLKDVLDSEIIVLTMCRK